MTDKDWPEILDGIKRKIAADMGIKIVTTTEIMRGLAVSNIVLPYMSFAEQLSLARKHGTVINAPPFFTRLLWRFRPFTRLLTLRGRAADRIIKSLLK